MPVVARKIVGNKINLLPPFPSFNLLIIILIMSILLAIVNILMVNINCEILTKLWILSNIVLCMLFIKIKEKVSSYHENVNF